MTYSLVIVMIFFTFLHVQSENVLCSSCATNLKQCLMGHNDPASFITGKNTDVCDCCNDYTDCVDSVTCDMIPSVCISIDCSNKAYIGWIAICVMILVILVVIVTLYTFNRPKDIDFEIFVDNPNREHFLDLKLKDIKMYQRLAEVVLSSSSTSESDDETDSHKPIVLVK
ncbi:Uncharacterized protein QTN25_002627 [Entamoeba marina]